MKNKQSIKILYVKCNHPSERFWSDGDEVYMTCQADAGHRIRIPAGRNTSHPMEKHQVWQVADSGPNVFKFHYELLVCLWDHDVPDDPNTSTFLINYDFVANAGNGQVQEVTVENEDKANYTIGYQYILA